jgi:hypothetical protein
MPATVGGACNEQQLTARKNRVARYIRKACNDRDASNSTKASHNLCASIKIWQGHHQLSPERLANKRKGVKSRNVGNSNSGCCRNNSHIRNACNNRDAAIIGTLTTGSDTSNRRQPQKRTATTKMVIATVMMQATTGMPTETETFEQQRKQQQH